MLRIILLVLIPSVLFADDNVNTDYPSSNITTTQDIKSFRAQGEFNEVKEFLLQSIAGRGIKISGTSYISKMLDRTGEAVGSDKQIFKNAEAIGFCSAILSRQMMERNPHHIVFCPYTIVIYELAQQPGTVFIAYRRPFYSNAKANDQTLNAIDDLLSGIIGEVVE
jgi:uncharacterized protein (DUF302 family)